MIKESIWSRLTRSACDLVGMRCNLTKVDDGVDLCSAQGAMAQQTPEGIYFRAAGKQEDCDAVQDGGQIHYESLRSRVGCDCGG